MLILYFVFIVAWSWHLSLHGHVLHMNLQLNILPVLNRCQEPVSGFREFIFQMPLLLKFKMPSEAILKPYGIECMG